MAATVKVWIRQTEVKNIHEQGYPNQYFLQSQLGSEFVEMTIGTDQFLEWQMKKMNPIQERSRTGKQILND